MVVKHGRGEQDVEQEIGCEQFKLIVNSYQMLSRPSYSSMLYLSIPHYRVQRTRGIIPGFEGKSPIQYLI